jgi:exopolysaccharide biosynthesis polyprenyl glycosylphosphotransferase
MAGSRPESAAAERGMKARERRRLSVQLPISERRVLIAAGDVLAVNLAVVAALRVWAWRGRIDFSLGFVLSQAHWFVILSLLWLILAAANDFYNLRLTARWPRAMTRLIQIELQLLIVYLVIFFLSPRDALPRLFILYYAVASSLLILAWRMSRPFLIGWQPRRRRVLVMGAGWEGAAIIEAINQEVPDDYEVVGIISADEDEGGKGALDLVGLARQNNIHEVVLATSHNLKGELFQAIMDCHEHGISVIPMPLLFEEITGRVPVEYVGGNWMVVLPLEGRSPFDPYPLLKRLIDLTLAVAGLLLFGLIFPCLALLIVIDSHGPVFYKQERVGKAGRTFTFIKLRSMIPDAEAQSGPLWAVRSDPRVTRAGRLLRKSRLDELPQLINVLRGEMSLVGPRPERPAFVEQLQKEIPFYRARLTVLPGLTGWAQVNYGYGRTVEDALVKLQYDLYYIRHRSLLLDGLILLRTVGKIIRLQGM